MKSTSYECTNAKANDVTTDNLHDTQPNVCLCVYGVCEIVGGWVEKSLSPSDEDGSELTELTVD